MVCLRQKFTCAQDLPALKTCMKKGRRVSSKTRQPLSDLIYRQLQNLLMRSGLYGCFRSRTLVIILRCPL